MSAPGPGRPVELFTTFESEAPSQKVATSVAVAIAIAPPEPP